MITLSHKNALMQLGAKIGRLGMTHGSAGNLSAKVGEHILMTISGSDLTALGEEDICVLSLDGKLLEGKKPSKELPLHLACYKKNEATQAVIHLHAPKSMAVSCLKPWGKYTTIPPVSPYFVMRVGATPMVAYAAPGDENQAKDIEKLPADVSAFLLQNHGLVVTGKTIDEALDRTIELEDSCALYLDILPHNPRYLTGDECRLLSEKYGSYWPE